MEINHNGYQYELILSGFDYDVLIALVRHAISNGWDKTKVLNVIDTESPEAYIKEGAKIWGNLEKKYKE